MSRPEDLKYATTHEWARISDDGAFVVVGITDHAVEELSDLVHVELPEVGTRAEKDSRLGEIESTKTVSDLIAPVSGEIVEVNADIVEKENLDLISNSPFGDGWLVKIRIEGPEELDALLTAADYAAQLEAEMH